jgi:L,D-transpeptidase catalytic domain
VVREGRNCFPCDSALADAFEVLTSLPMHCPRIIAIAIAITLAPLSMTSTCYAQAHTKGREVAPLTSVLKPGDYVWRPEVSPAGPVVILVSLPDQLLYVFRNGVRIGRSTVSSGKPGRRTPTGVFTVLQKKVHHESSIYKGAKMPHMQRLTWTGIAMHAGNLPGYPASAGCVRLPVDFAAKLYSITTIGTTVIIADNKSAPKETVKPGLLFSSDTGTAGRGFKWTPEKAPKGPVSIIISGADRAAYVYRNGVEIGKTPVSGLERLSGSYVFTALESFDSSGRREWISTATSGRRAPNLKELANRLGISSDFDDDIRSLITAGTTLVITDLPVSTSTHSAPGFNILTD